ncbi:uncharacterized protein LOC131934822 [Physella acuta]|uniref:uncharacterized protein LOC131934822 n=1 Tax=Physella acuta TaxID=109671 RepID=UPI0027DC331A|nr:uncharacterized protein LOC131934822 [Physella acuta]
MLMKCKVFLFWLVSCLVTRICEAINYTVKAGDKFECKTEIMFSKYDVIWTLTASNGTAIKIFTYDSQLKNYIDVSYNPAPTLPKPKEENIFKNNMRILGPLIGPLIFITIVLGMIWDGVV